MAQFPVEIWTHRWKIFAIGIFFGILTDSKFLQRCCGIVMLWALKKYWKTALWLFWQYLYYCSGLFIWHYIFKRVAHICCSLCLCKEQYATGPSCPNADQKQHRMHMASSTPPPHHAQAYGIIQTWKYCKIYDSCNVPRSFLGSRRFVAHVDTGNRANTAISKAAFQALCDL
jgi:hypothetical protein